MLRTNDLLASFAECCLSLSQEEPVNNGAFTYLQPRLEMALDQTEHHKNKRVKYAGRGEDIDFQSPVPLTKSDSTFSIRPYLFRGYWQQSISQG